MVAVDVEVASAVELEASFGVAFGVELDELYPIRGEEGHERNKMCFCHRVVDGNEMLVLHLFDGNTVIGIGGFRLQGWQDNATTANEGMIYRMIGIRSTLILCNKACFADTSLEKHS